MQEKLKQVASTRVGTLAARCSHSRRVPGPPDWGDAPMVRRNRRAAYDVCLSPAVRGGLVGRSFVMKAPRAHGGEGLFSSAGGRPGRTPRSPWTDNRGEQTSASLVSTIES